MMLLPTALKIATATSCLLLSPANANLFDNPGNSNPGIGNSDTVIKIQVKDKADIQHVADEYDILSVDPKGMTVTVLLHPSDKAQLDKDSYACTVDEQATLEFANAAAAGIAGYPCYRTVEETYATGADLAANNPDIVQWNDIGNSWEKDNLGGGYDIFALNITNQNVFPEPGTRKPVFFANCAIHAREYTTAELCTRFAELLVNGHGTDADATALIDHHEIHLVLQTNPDGRKMAETGLSWRKNKNNYECTDSNSRGVDLNRNFPFKWGGSGSSGSECQLTYRGVAPRSEPETNAILDYLDILFPTNQRGVNPQDSDPAPLDATGVAMDIHSYGELVLYPWGYTSALSGNHDQFVTFGEKLAFFNGYAPQPAIDLYVTTGTTDDTYYGNYGVAAFCIELGNSFFEPCSNFENTILPDNLKALMYAAKVARTPYMTPAGPDAYDLSLSENRVPKGQTVTLTATVNDGRYSGSEATQAIASVDVYAVIPPWASGATPIPMTASDGSLNSVIETVTVDINTSSLPVGKQLLYVEGTDADGNKGAFSAIFLEILQGTCVNAGANNGNVCYDDATCCARRLRGLQTCDGDPCSPQSSCCNGFVCEKLSKGDRICVASNPPPVGVPTTSPTRKPSASPSLSLAPSVLVCECEFPPPETADPTSSPTPSPTPLLCGARGAPCVQGQEGQCCSGACSFKGPNYKCN